MLAYHGQLATYNPVLITRPGPRNPALAIDETCFTVISDLKSPFPNVIYSALGPLVLCSFIQGQRKLFFS